MNKIDKGLQGGAIYQKSKLYPFQFQRILKLVFFVPMFQLVTPWEWGKFWPQRNHMNKTDKGPQRDAKWQNIKALILPVSEKKNFEVGFLCFYIPLVTPGVGLILTPGASYEPTW